MAKDSDVLAYINNRFYSGFTVVPTSANKAYQRSATTGGTNNKGTGVVPVSFSQPNSGPIYAQVKDSTSNNVIKAAFQVSSSAPSGASSVNVTVDARVGGQVIEIGPTSTGPWYSTTSRIFCGRGIALWGQSQMANFMGKPPSYTGTNSSLGVTISQNSPAYLRYDGIESTVSTPVWAIPADGTNYNSTGIAEFLRRQENEYGVSCFVIGHAVQGTTVSQWVPGQANYTNLINTLNGSNGREAVFSYIGGTDAQNGTTQSDYETRLKSINDGIIGLSNAFTGTVQVTTCAAATRLSGAGGTAAQILAIRKGAENVASMYTGGQYIEPRDVTLADNIHQDQPGSIILAQHAHRSFTAANDKGPTFGSGTRSGAVITIPATFPSGATALSLVGSIADRVTVYPTGTTTGAYTISSVAVGANTVTITLSADPGAVAVDVWFLYHPDPSGLTPYDNMGYDNRTGDGITRGRQFTPSHAPIVVPALAPVAAFNDTFTEASPPVALQSHTAETGQTWSQVSGALNVTGIGVTNPTTSNGIYLSSYTPSSANTYIEGVLRVVDISAPVANAWVNYFIGASNGTGSVRYQAGIRVNSGTSYVYSIFRFNGGGTEVAVSGTFTPTPGDYTYRFEMNAGVLTLKVNGTTVLSYTDGTPLAAGRVGLRYNSDATTDTNGIHFMNIKSDIL